MPLQIVRQDITKMKVDAIVNTTNEEMVGYSGVDLAVHKAAGKGLDDECLTLAPLGLGEAKISGGYNLPSKYVIHTSGPVWHGGLLGESIILRSCYTESLKLAVEHGCETVAFPLISSGAYGYPKEEVLKFAIQTVTDFLLEHELNVYICVYDKDSYTFSRKLFNDIKTFIDDAYVDDRDDDIDFDEFFSGYESAEEAEDKEEAVFESRGLAKRKDEFVSEKLKPIFEARCCVSAADFVKGKSLEEYLKERDKSFSEMLFDFIDKSGMSDVECYKRANVDKRTFSKIKGKKGYRPSRQTIIAFAISLRLGLDDTQALLATMGFTLSRNSTFDNIILYFIHTGNYNIHEINEALFEFDQQLLGSGFDLPI